MTNQISTCTEFDVEHWANQNAVHMHWICLILLAKVNAYLSTSHQWLHLGMKTDVVNLQVKNKKQ